MPLKCLCLWDLIKSLIEYMLNVYMSMYMNALLLLAQLACSVNTVTLTYPQLVIVQYIMSAFRVHTLKVLWGEVTHHPNSQ